MAYGAAEGLSNPLEEYSSYWLKFYTQGTVTPLSMATDAAAGTLLAKAEISAGGTVPIGFIKTAGDAIFIPYLNAAYDAWLFPTEAEADANDTSSAVQIADNITLSEFSGTLTTDAELVTYTAPLTGAVASNVEAKLSESLSVDDFGAEGDDDGTGNGTDDTAAFNLAITAASGGWITISPRKKYRITAQLASTSSIRIRSSYPPIFESSGDAPNSDDDWFPTLILDATSLTGVADPTSATTGFGINLKGLMNIRLKGVNNAPYAAHFRPTQGYFENVLVEDFDYHGFWTRGGSLARVKDVRFIRCGRTDPVVNAWCHLAANTDTTDREYRRGCSWLAEARSSADQASPYVAGRSAGGVYSPTTFSLEDIWCDINRDTTQLNTSPRDLIFFDHISLTGKGVVGGYNGSWFGYSNGSFDSTYQETYSTGGESAGDAAAFSLVHLNCAISMDQLKNTEKFRNLREGAVQASTDFYGYETRTNANKYVSRINPYEIILGGYDPDGGSTAWSTYAAKGTTTNPSLTFNSTTRSWDISIGTNILPVVGFHLEQKGTVASGGGTDTVDRGEVTTLTDADAQGRWFDVEVFVGNTGVPYTYYYSYWKCVRTSSQTEWVKTAEIDLLSGAVTVAQTGASAKDLLITNTGGSVLNWKAFGKIMGDRQLDIDN